MRHGPKTCWRLGVEEELPLKRCGLAPNSWPIPTSGCIVHRVKRVKWQYNMVANVLGRRSRSPRPSALHLALGCVLTLNGWIRQRRRVGKAPVQDKRNPCGYPTAAHCAPVQVGSANLYSNQEHFLRPSHTQSAPIRQKRRLATALCAALTSSDTNSSLRLVGGTCHVE